MSALGVSFVVQSIIGFQATADGRALVCFALQDDSAVAINLPVDLVDASVLALKEAKSQAEASGAAASEPRLLLMTVKEWEVGQTFNDNVVLTITAGNARRSFATDPKTAGAIGRAMLATARESNNARSRTPWM